MTQSAVSHRLRRLESFMGMPLLARTSGGMRATPAGEALSSGLGALMSGLGELRAQCRAAAGSAALRVGVSAALADYWLLARLPDFHARHSAVPIELIILESAAQAAQLDLDIAIHWLREGEARDTSTQRILFREHVFPVCHPRLLQDPPLADPMGLAALPLIHKGATEGSVRCSRMDLDGMVLTSRHYDAASARAALCQHRHGDQCRAARQRGHARPLAACARRTCRWPPRARAADHLGYAVE